MIHMVLVPVPHSHSKRHQASLRDRLAQPRIQEQIVEVIKVILQELVPERVVEQIVDVPQILEQNVEVIKVILQEQFQQMRFFLQSVCGGWTTLSAPARVPPSWT